MKTITFTPLFFSMLIALFLYSCRGEVIETLSESEAAEVIQSAISADTEGLVVQIEDAAEIAQAYLDSCGQVFDSTIHKTQTLGIRSFDYTFIWNWQMTCNGLNIPQSFKIDYNAKGDYETSRMSSDDISTGNFTIIGLAPSAPNLIYDGSITRSGAQVSKIGNQSSFTSQVQISTQTLTFSKNSQEIISGTANATISGMDSNGNNFSFSGQIVFSGNQAANLTINGNIYPIQW